MNPGLLFLTECIGVVAFALSGAAKAIDKDLDLFGIIVLGVTTASGGGVVRDLLLGVTPPAMFQNPVYAELALFTSLSMFLLVRYGFGSPYARRSLDRVIELCDAVGLGIFAVTGAHAAIAAGYGDNGFLAVFVGTLTGVGGGMLRDIMAREIPFVLTKNIYALAALAGAYLYYHLQAAGVSAAMTAGATLTFVIRLLAERFGWQLPRAHPKEPIPRKEEIL